MGQIANFLDKKVQSPYFFLFFPHKIPSSVASPV